MVVFLFFWVVSSAFDKTSSAVVGVGVQWRRRKNEANTVVWKMSFELNLQGKSTVSWGMVDHIC